jgi:hypothetical protein
MNITKLTLRVLLLIAILAGVTVPSYASISEGDEPWTRPQLGIWFGPVTPVGPLWSKLDTYLGGGAYVRLPLFEYGTIGADISYQEQPSKTLNSLAVVPMYGNFIFRLPLHSPISISFKAGTGYAWVRLQPENRSQFDPMFMTGAEVSFPAGTFVNIGMRIDYIYLYESWRAGAKHDGHLLNAGLTLFFNLDIF